MQYRKEIGVWNSSDAMAREDGNEPNCKLDEKLTSVHDFVVKCEFFLMFVIELRDLYQ